MKKDRPVLGLAGSKSPLRSPKSPFSKSPVQTKTQNPFLKKSGHGKGNQEKNETVTLALDLTKFRKKKIETEESIIADLRKDISKLSQKMTSNNPNLFSPFRGISICTY